MTALSREKRNGRGQAELKRHEREGSRNYPTSDRLPDSVGLEVTAVVTKVFELGQNSSEDVWRDEVAVFPETSQCQIALEGAVQHLLAVLL
jgi:hypothetical protein